MEYSSLVIGGSGNKGYSCIGAIQQLSNELKNIKRFLGVSSGSILATLLAIGCNSEELKKYFDMVDLSQFKTNYTSIYTYYKLATKKGIHDSSVFIEEIITKILQEKTGSGNITFKQIYETFGKILVIPTACINKREMYYYHYISNPNMEVKYAIERSCCVPFVFYPVNHKGDTLVDAGVIDNYPLYFFDREDELPNSRLNFVSPDMTIKPSNKTLGILVIDDNTSKDSSDPYLGNDKSIKMIDYLKCILNTILTTNTRAHIGRDYWENTVAINIGRSTDGVSNLSLDEATKQKYFTKGVSAANEFLKRQID